MHEADINRIGLTALGSILFAMLLVAFSNLVFEPGRPAVPGYALPTSAAPSEAPAAAAAAPAARLSRFRFCSPARIQRKARRTPRSARLATISTRARLRRSAHRFGALSA